MFKRNEILRFAPDLPGIYYLYSKRKKLVYIGKSAVSLRRRLWQHYINYENAKERIELLNRKIKFNWMQSGIQQVKPFEYFRFSIILDEDFLHLYEINLIDEYRPPYNYIQNIMEPIDRNLFSHLWKFAKGLHQSDLVNSMEKKS